MADLKAVDEQPKLIHPDITSEIPGVKTEDMYDGIIGPIPIGKEESLHHMLNVQLRRVKMQA